MFSNIASFIKTLFGGSKLGIIFKIIFAKAASTAVSEIMDSENQRIAYEFVKILHGRKDLTGIEKANLFNKKMLEWTVLIGKKMDQSVINCLRELAVTALKSQENK